MGPGHPPKDPFYGKTKRLESGGKLRKTAAVNVNINLRAKKSEFLTGFTQRSIKQRDWRVNINFISRRIVDNIRIAFRIIFRAHKGDFYLRCIMRIILAV